MSETSTPQDLGLTDEARDFMLGQRAFQEVRTRDAAQYQGVAGIRGQLSTMRIDRARSQDVGRPNVVAGTAPSRPAVSATDRRVPRRLRAAPLTPAPRACLLQGRGRRRPTPVGEVPGVGQDEILVQGRSARAVFPENPSGVPVVVDVAVREILRPGSGSAQDGAGLRGTSRRHRGTRRVVVETVGSGGARYPLPTRDSASHSSSPQLVTGLVGG